MPFARPRFLPPKFLRGAALVVFATASGGAGCPESGGGTEDGGTEYFGTDGSSSSSSGFGTDGTSTTMGTSTTSPTTTEPSTTAPTTTMSSTSDPDTGTTDPTDTSGTGCGSGGPFTINMTGRNDLYGHFGFLFLFYPEDPPTPETVVVDVGADGTITLDVEARAAGSGSGHSGLAGLTGTIDGNCVAAIDTEVEFVSDTGPFGTIQVIIDGTFPAAADGPVVGTMTLLGGGIPSGPITYEFSSQ